MIETMIACGLVFLAYTQYATVNRRLLKMEQSTLNIKAYQSRADDIKKAQQVLPLAESEEFVV